MIEGTREAAGGYTCHSDNLGTAPRCKPYETRSKGEVITICTEWKDIPCGHITSHLDDGCEGCKNRR